MKVILFASRHSHPEIDGLPEIFSADICPTALVEQGSDEWGVTVPMSWKEV